MTEGIIVLLTSETGYHIQRQVEIIPVTLDVAGVDDVGLRQMGRVLLEAFFQRDGGESSG